MNQEIMEIVKEAIHFRDRKKYELIAYTIMPNHLHIIFTPIVRLEAPNEEEPITDSSNRRQIFDLAMELNDNSNCRKISNQKLSENLQSKDLSRGYLVTNILQDLKKFTAVKCNKVLNRSGAFWQHESYDHIIRNDEELNHKIKYTLDNPIKAGLCTTREEWVGNYCVYT